MLDQFCAFEVKDHTLQLRRFMEISKFEHLVRTNSLYLTPASSFSDKLEGHYTHQDYEQWDNQLVSWGFDEYMREIAVGAKASMARSNQGTVVVSCWTKAPADDARMWQEYAKSPEAVVIETTVGSIRKALGKEFLIVPVQYVDFDLHRIPKDDSLQPFFYKRDSYRWEREVRIVGNMLVGAKIGTARMAPVDLSVLITKVFYSASASQPSVDIILQMVNNVAPNAVFEVLDTEHIRFGEH